ncbi:MAG: hypothetical protein AAGA60_27075 [Cyanobacteria bacterium P01_E01_bin.42]
MSPLEDLGISIFAEDNIDPEDYINTLILPPELIQLQEYGISGRDKIHPKLIDIYHVGLLLLNLIEQKELEFSEDDIVDSRPSIIAENSKSSYGKVISMALKRDVEQRISTPLEFWKKIKQIRENLV